MKAFNRVVCGALVGGVVLLGSVLEPKPVQGHGAPEFPKSRSYVCFEENPENPKSDACEEAVDVGGTQAFYDWHEVNIRDANGRHRELIPDGQLCSAGREKYKGLDLVRGDWPAQIIPTGSNFDFIYRGATPHAVKYMRGYITKKGFDPATQPLTWNDLEETPLFDAQGITTTDGKDTANGKYVISTKLPDDREVGSRAIIYMIWQRSLSPEAFYACSDIIIGDSNGNAPTPTPDPTEPAENILPWKAGTSYKKGTKVTFEGSTYKSRLDHTAGQYEKPPWRPDMWRLKD
ncbi:hypothetical protein BC008_18025 [Mastigocoleus testarum BC008]|uniref:Uncharacterized protein n=1 Tax=Mastigocoleus testarum BC008 TaxID=371196 RepID=A0A0V7ZJ72_9CYAN|nr:hypothetical protein BC008_18025 [Mastigocoleus testarum BC008]